MCGIIAYFGKKNTSYLQDEIKRQVYNLSRGQFRLDVDQSPEDLLLFMRSVFIDYATHSPNNISGQVKTLNRITIKLIMPDIMSNIKQQVVYLYDISNPINPPDQPINVNKAGRKTLPSITSIWGF